MELTKFADAYPQARTDFRTAAQAGGFELERFPCGDSTDDALAVDVAYRGYPEPRKLLVIVSGVHGVELMAGSGCQVRLIQDGQLNLVPDDLGVLLIHAINPWGAAHLRRTNEHNVDLCRNGLDYAQPLPENPAYFTLHELLCEPDRKRLTTNLRKHMSSAGAANVVRTLMAGQYSHANGFNYGGNATSRSLMLLLSLIQKHSGRAENTVVLELHSGLGKYAQAMMISMQRDQELARARRWFGPEVVSPFADLQTNPDKPLHQPVGHTAAAYERANVSGDLTAITVEFGTFDMQQNFEALIEDHWLCCVAQNCDDAITEQIKHNMLRAHLPDDPAWQAAIAAQCKSIVARALVGLSGAQA